MAMAYWAAGAALQAVLNGVWQGLAVVALAWAALRLARANAATRYAVWWAALAATILLPLAPALVGGMTRGVPRMAAAPWTPLVTLPAPVSWIVWLLGAWLLGAVAMLGRVLWSCWRLERLKRTAQPLTTRQEERFQALLRAHAPARRVRAGRSAGVRVPVAAGFGDAAILLPESLSGQLSDEELDHVLAHELAHLRRRDDWTNLAQKLIEAVFFFHPVVLWVARRLNLEREIACDDWVVSVTGRPRPYAACLTKLVELSGLARSPQLAPGAATRKYEFSRRIETLLGHAKRLANPQFSKVTIFVCSALVIAGALGLAQFSPVAVAAPVISVPKPVRVSVRAPEMAYVRPQQTIAALAPKLETHVRRSSHAAAQSRRAPESWPQRAVRPQGRMLSTFLSSNGSWRIRTTRAPYIAFSISDKGRERFSRLRAG